MHDQHASNALFSLCALTALLATSCSGGGGGGGNAGPGPGSGIDEGTFSIEAFGYEDTDPSGFHPLGTDGTQLLSRKELAIFLPMEGTQAAGGWLLDDPSAGHAQLFNATALQPDLRRVLAVASGDLDGDGREDIVICVGGSGIPTRLATLQRTVAGGTLVTTIITLSAQITDARLALGDLDGDGRDEIALATIEPFGRLRVFGGPDVNFAQLHSAVFSTNVTEASVCMVQLDDDVELELCFSVTAGFSKYLRLIDDASADFALLRDTTDVASTGGQDAFVLGADTDGDGIDELVVCSLQPDIFGELRVRTYRFIGGNLIGGVTFTSSLDFFIDGFPGAWSAVAYDPSGDGREHVAVVLPISSGSRFRLLTLNPTSSASWTAGPAVNLEVSHEFAQVTLIAGDHDSDGDEELYAGFHTGSGSTKTRRVAIYDPGIGGAPVYLPIATAAGAGANFSPAMTLADVDADGLAIRYTGLAFLSLADPMPIAVLAAPPTRAGISQNYGGSSTSYGVASSTAQSYGVTNRVTASVYAGFSITGLLGVFGASATKTLSEQLERTSTTTEKVTQVQAFAGAHDDDVVIFQSTLNKSYEYEIIGAPDPTLIGTYMTIDVPVSTRVYKWTVPYYNASMTPANQIGADVLSHAIGDPASYRTLAELDSDTGAYVGWRSQELGVGQGNGTNAAGIELEDEQATSEQRTFSVDYEVGITAGGATFGGSFGVSDGSIYSITASQTTSYVGAVGDISSPADYSAWRYDFGLSVYQRGVLADAGGQPSGLDPGVRPFQVVTYWVTPTGSQY